MKFWQQQLLMTQQALVGVISPNFRLVSLTAREKHVSIRVVLEQEDAKDREWIQEFHEELYCLEPSDVTVEVHTQIYSGNIIVPAPSEDGEIVAYARREFDL